MNRCKRRLLSAENYGYLSSGFDQDPDLNDRLTAM